MSNLKIQFLTVASILLVNFGLLSSDPAFSLNSCISFSNYFVDPTMFSTWRILLLVKKELYFFHAIWIISIFSSVLLY